ncbi:trichohyalin-like isoform X3 [Labrus mixtus]|uniref:trichohyalin-like isoform X3 n=1 Tax=Labrus mixtus TaxID=508554 RepID=UPI0029BFF6CA|nr:trichohyalin-like isoform X3 [Labrus mixtus]
MGRKLDLSGLSDNEAEHVLQVVQRDMKLRKKEEERLSELKQELDDEGSRCLLLSRQGYFNHRCCIRCCSPFTFLLNPKRKCHDCKYNVCKACRVYSKREKAWLCSSCEKSRLLKTQNLEWFYTNVKTRFKRFGSAKVLKTLYRKHLVEHSTLSERTEGSTYEESICNEGSISGSDSAFYRQSEEHSMEETLTVALRVAEEALDEAITKAEFDTSSQAKQNEAHYLREHKGELVEELAKTIVQKIINRKKTLADMRAEYVQDWPVEHNTDLHHHHQSASDRATSSVKQQPGLFRSHSAFSLLENDSPGMVQDSPKASVKEDGGPAMTAWKSVDRLDNAGVSAVLHSMDGNWIALQSAQLSRPSLLTKRKSQVYSALERESAVVSAYEGMGSDNDIKHGSDSSLGTALQEVHRKMVDSNMDLQDTCDRILSPLMSRRASGDKLLSPMLGRRSSRDIVLSDSEGNWKPNKPLLGVIKLKVPAEIRRPPSRRTSIIDMNFNTEGVRQEENMGAAERSQQKKKSEKESSSLNNSKKDNHPPEAVTPDTLSSGGMTTPEILELQTDITGQVANQMDQELTAKLEQLAGRVDDSSTGEEKEAVYGDAVDDGRREEEEDKDSDEEDEQQQRMEVESDEGRTEDEEKEEEEGNEEDDEEINYRLNKLITQSRLKYFSSTDEELDKAGKSEEEEEEEGGEGDKDEDTEEEQNEEREEKTNGFTFKLCQLEKESRAYQFSSTEDEMDRVGIEEKTEDEEENGKNVELAVKVCRLAYQVNANQFSSTEDELDSVGLLDEDMKTREEEEEEEEDEKKEELALKVCRLAHQVNASQFSSTEDELDRVGRGEEEEEGTDEEALWKLRAEKAVQAAHMRDLASLVGASEFSSTEDNLDKVGQTGQEVNKVTGSDMWENAEGNNQDKEESFEDLDVNMFDLRDEIEEKKKGSSDETVEEKRDGMEDGVTEEGEVLKGTERARDAETELKTVDEGKEIIKVAEENQPGARQEDDKIDESSGSQGSWETAKDEENSEEYAEFDRIISSMLMMTLEDMQVQTVNDEAAENGGNVSEQAQVKVDENVQIEGGSGSVDREVTIGNESELMHVEVDEEVKKGGESELEHVKVDGEVQTGAESGLENVEMDVEFKIEGESEVQDRMIDAQSTEDTKETESKKELESPSENAPQSYAEENPEANIQKQEESEDAKGRKDNEQGKESDPHAIRSPAKTAVMSIKEMLETYEAKQLCQRIGLHDDKQQDRGGKVSTMRLMMEAQSDVTEERMEETKGKKTCRKDQSRRSSLDDVLQTPEEIQMSSSAVQRIGLHDDKQDIGGKVSTMLQMMEAQSDIAETKERMEETKGKKTYKKDQSRRSSLDDVLQTPEEIQMRYSAVQRIGLYDDKQDIGGKVSTMLQMMEAQSDVTETKERMEETKGKKTYRKDQSRRSSLDDVLQTPEEIQMRYSAVQRIGLHDDKQDKGGKVSTMLQMMEAQSDVTEERMEETKGKKTCRKDQSRRSSLDDVLQTPEEIQMRYSAVQRIGLHDDKQDIGGKVSTMLQMMEAQSDVTEERMEETKGKKTYRKDQSRRSSLDDVLQTPEEIQMRYSAVQRIGLHDDKQDKGGKVSTMLQMMEAQSDVTEERMEETKGKKMCKKDQSRRSSLDDVLQTPEEIQMRYSAVQLRNITTEVLKVLNTTEDLLHGVKGGDKLRSSTPSLPPNTDPRKLDQQFSKLEENVYVAAGSVYSLEAELGDLEECARSISGSTSDMELSFLEEQVASAAAKVQQSDLQICDISARIAALKNAGLNVDTQSRPTKARTIPVMPVTLDSSRQFRRRLPAPPVKDKET